MKLGQVLWRKLSPSDIETADDALSSVCYDLLNERKHKLAQKLLDFACCTLLKHTDERSRLVFLVNRAQAYKWDGQPEKALEIVATQDWSASGPGFQLAAAVLRDEYDKATNLMESIGATGDVSKNAYKTWPLFREIKKTKKFIETFEKIFGEPFEKATPVEKSLEPSEEKADLGSNGEPPPTIK